MNVAQSPDARLARAAEQLKTLNRLYTETSRLFDESLDAAHAGNWDEFKRLQILHAAAKEAHRKFSDRIANPMTVKRLLGQTVVIRVTRDSRNGSFYDLQWGKENDYRFEQPDIEVEVDIDDELGDVGVGAARLVSYVPKIDEAGNEIGILFRAGQEIELSPAEEDMAREEYQETKNDE